jgi:sodium-dependent dicarboxylate transporter 2/3/5
MNDPAARTLSHRIGFFLGPIACVLLSLAPLEGLTPEARRVAGLAVWMAIWWATEAVPIAATSLLPLVALPLMGAGTEKQAAAPYANPIVLLLLGGSILAVGIERWRLHARIALNALTLSGDRPRLIVLGFMAVTAFNSMWISNTATALMMMPIALSVAATVGSERKGFAQAMVLGVAYAASIGGIATPIGTPTNLIAMSWLKDQGGETIGFADWMALGLPAMLALVPLGWLVVAFGLGPGERAAAAAVEIRAERDALGPIRAPEARVLLLFALVIGLWVSGEWLRGGLGLKGVTDMSIVMAGAIAMMVIPAGGGERRALVTWIEATKIPWSVILLFGGGISLAEAMERTKLAAALGDALGVLAGAPPLLVVAVVTALVILLTEFMSNVATITMLLPVLAALSKVLGVEPVVLIVPAAIAASCGFMMPAGTGPNAVAYASGKTTVAAMMGRGFFVNLAALCVLSAVGLWIAPAILR